MLGGNLITAEIAKNFIKSQDIINNKSLELKIPEYLKPKNIKEEENEND